MDAVESCNCWIGSIIDWDNVDLLLNDYIEKIMDYAEDSESPLKYLTDKCSNLFNFCPYCGEKINYPELRKRLKEYIEQSKSPAKHSTKGKK